MNSYRYELKFVISQTSSLILKQRLRHLMTLDEHSRGKNFTYFIRSLYFDDHYDSALFEKIDGTEMRKKYRIRMYRFNDQFIRLECKHKHNYLTKKEQQEISKTDFYNLLQGKTEQFDLSQPGLLSRFVSEMLHDGLRPSVIVDYYRLAFTYPLSDVRITFDEKIRAGKPDGDFFDPDLPSTPIIDDGQMVMEVKFNDYLPEAIAIVLQSEPSVRQAISKFAFCRISQ
jgi:hypothetical protein